MIPQNELRIGNLITFSPSGKAAKANERHVRITEIRNKSAIADDNGLALELFYESASTKPIPLSAEILEKCKFTCTDYETRKKYSFEDFEISLYPNGEFTFMWNGQVVYLKSVHQLQNIFYWLTGEELPV